MIEKNIRKETENAAAERSKAYVLDVNICKKVLAVYDNFRAFIHQNGGGIVLADVNDKKGAVFVGEVPDVDLYREGLERFCELLGMIDTFDVSVTESGSLSIGVSVLGLWKAVF